jgi:hypothetical protein
MTVGAVILAAALSFGACADDGGPRLVSAMPSSASRGTDVALSGRHLCGSTGDCAGAAGEVQIGEVFPPLLAQIVDYSDTAAHIVVPVGAPVGATQIIVTVDERASNALAFEVLP